MQPHTTLRPAIGFILQPVFSYMDNEERARLTQLFTAQLAKHQGKPRPKVYGLEAINAAFDQKNKANPWIRLALEKEAEELDLSPSGYL